jgi:hypothetical protein
MRGVVELISEEEAMKPVLASSPQLLVTDSRDSVTVPNPHTVVAGSS